MKVFPLESVANIINMVYILLLIKSPFHKSLSMEAREKIIIVKIFSLFQKLFRSFLIVFCPDIWSIISNPGI